MITESTKIDETIFEMTLEEFNIIKIQINCKVPIKTACASG